MIMKRGALETFTFIIYVLNNPEPNLNPNLNPKPNPNPKFIYNNRVSRWLQNKFRNRNVWAGMWSSVWIVL